MSGADLASTSAGLHPHVLLVRRHARRELRGSYDAPKRARVVYAHVRISRCTYGAVVDLCFLEHANYK